jgi:hypothetical protein
VTIDQLPDEVLLEIFSFYMALSGGKDAWHTLTHVCQRWRYVVFGSPRRLDLSLLCTNLNGTLTRTKLLDIWPQLPIAIHVYYGNACPPTNVADVISVVKRNDRVCKIHIHNAPSSLLKEFAAISEPFPALLELVLSSPRCAADTPILPDSFLGGFVPRLQSLNLWGIPFPAIGKPFSSTLVTLHLGSIPPSGYISPEAMVNILSTLTRLKDLHLIYFEIPQFLTHGASKRPSVLTRFILPALTTFGFLGNNNYLEEIVSRIDAPLDSIAVSLFDQPVIDIPLLRDFIGRTKIFNATNRADISVSNDNTRVSLFRRKGDIDFKMLDLRIFYVTHNLHLSSLLQACDSFLPPLPNLEHLGISDFPSGRWQEVENTHWRGLLRPFVTVKDLVLDEPTVLSIASALQELVGERVSTILPALQNIFLEGFESPGPVPEGIGKFIAARELSGSPVIAHYRKTKRVIINSSPSRSPSIV